MEEIIMLGIVLVFILIIIITWIKEDKNYHKEMEKRESEFEKHKLWLEKEKRRHDRMIMEGYAYYKDDIYSDDDIEHNVYDKPKDDKGRWFIGTTKTETGTRKIHISQTLKIALQNYKNKQEYLKKIYGKKYIYYHLEDVTNKSGKIIEHRIVREEISNKDSNRFDLIFTKENGAYIGTDITSLLGHKNIETTENFYISSTEDSRKYATELFDNISKSETINKIIEYKINLQ